MGKTTLACNEALTLLRLTWPLMLAQLSQTAMGFVDTVMSGRVSALDLAAVAVGASVFFPVYLFLYGLMMAVTPLVAQAYGRGNPQAIRLAIRQGMVIGFVVGALLMPLLWLAEPLMFWMEVDEKVVPIAGRYLFAISWGMPLAGVFFSLRNGGDGLARPRLSMYAGFFGLAVNIVANYVLIYGKLGLPAMGGVGCGWASSISILAMMLFMGYLLDKSRIPALSGLFTFRLDKFLVHPGAFLRLGLPIGVTFFIECSVFALITLLVAKAGAEVVAAHQIAANFAGLVYMLPYGLSTAMTVRVGYCIGRQRLQRLKRAVTVGLSMAFVISTLNCILMFIFAEWIAALYTAELQIRPLAITLICLAALFQIPDAMQVNCGGILRGFKDTRMVLVISIVAYWGVGLPMGYWMWAADILGTGNGPQGFWVGLICALSASAVLLGGRVWARLRRATREQRRWLLSQQSSRP